MGVIEAGEKIELSRGRARGLGFEGGSDPGRGRPGDGGIVRPAGVGAGAPPGRAVEGFLLLVEARERGEEFRAEGGGHVGGEFGEEAIDDGGLVEVGQGPEGEVLAFRADGGECGVDGAEAREGVRGEVREDDGGVRRRVARSE